LALDAGVEPATVQVAGEEVAVEDAAGQVRVKYLRWVFMPQLSSDAILVN
jgi:hypothetical protein